MSNAEEEHEVVQEGSPRPVPDSTADDRHDHVRNNHVTSKPAPPAPPATASNSVDVVSLAAQSLSLINGCDRPLSSSNELQNGTPRKSLSNGMGDTTDIKLGSMDQQLEFLKAALSKTSAEAAQKLLRQHWRVFLFDNYNEEHISYVMRAGLKNCQPQTVERIFRDEGMMRQSLLQTLTKKKQVITGALQNATSTEILDYVPEDMLDNAVVERLKIVSARELIRWLAEADRLGYKFDDILDDIDETVRPNLSSFAGGEEASHVTMSNTGPRPPLDISLPFRDPLLEEQNRNAQEATQRLTTKLPLTCPTCHVQFGSMSGYTHHITKKVCSKTAPADGFHFWCYNCRQGFTTRQGQEYHRIRDVCNAPKDEQGNLLNLSYVNPPPPVSIAAPPQHHGPNLAPVQFQVPPLLPSIPNVAPSYQNREGPSNIPPSAPARVPFQASQPTPISTSTPRSTQGSSEKVIPGRRLSPSDLTPIQLADMNAKLAAAEAKYEADIATIPSTATSAERERRMTTLKQGHATRKSMIRKSFGVSLRMRARQRAAQEDAAASPIPIQAATRLEAYRAPSASQGPNQGAGQGVGHVSSAMPSPVVVSGFSPINAPARNPTRPGPPNQSPSLQQQQQPIRGSPLGANDEQARKRRRTSQDGGYDHPRHPLQNQPHPINQFQQPANTHQSGPLPLPSSLLQEVRSEDAAAKVQQVAKKVPIKNAQAQWEALQPRSNAIDRARPVSSGGSVGAGAGEVIVLSSSESGSDDDKRVAEATAVQIASRNSEKTVASTTTPNPGGNPAISNPTLLASGSSAPVTSAVTTTNPTNPSLTPSPNVSTGTLPSAPTSRPSSRPGSSRGGANNLVSSRHVSPALSAGIRGQTPGSRPQSSDSGSGRPVGGFMARRGGLGTSGKYGG